MPQIYLLLTRSPSILSKTIHQVTKDTYTHTALSPDGGRTLYSFCRKYPAFPLPAGFMEENIFDGFYALHRHMPCALLSLPVTHEAYRKLLEEIESFREQKERYRFDITGLLFCRLGIKRTRPYHYFCSRFVGELLEKCGAITLPRDPFFMRPQSYLFIKEFTCLYQGTLDGLQASLNRPAPLPRIARLSALTV